MYKLISIILIFTSTMINADSWTSKASMNVARHGIGSGVINGKLYAIGGSVSGTVLDDNEVYNPISNSWQTSSYMLVPRTGLPASAVVNNEIYMMGGLYYEAILGLNMSFNSQTYTWKVRSSMPTPRYDLCCAVVDEKIYAIGGCGYNGECTMVEEFDPLTKTWSYKADMPIARTGLNCAVFDGKIYVIGGRDPGFNYLNVTECYDPLTDTWTTCTPMPTPRCYPVCVELGGLIYVISGLTAQNEVTANEAYDPINDTWYIRAPIPTPRKGPAFGVIDGKIYVAGGSNGYSGYLTVNEEYQPDSLTNLEESSPVNPKEITDLFATMTTRCITINSSYSDVTFIKVTLYNATGQLQDEWTISDLNNVKLYSTKSTRFSKGTYFINIETERGIIRKKVTCVQ